MELDAAWDSALDAPDGDDGPWRVLADMLLAEGALQGEWLLLELDAVRGPLKGLARLRAQQLRAEPHFILPEGVRPEDAIIERATLVAVSGHAEQLTGPANDRRWRSVRRLSLRYLERADGGVTVPTTPLLGGQLQHVEFLSWLPFEALELLVDAPPLPRLARLGVSASVQRTARWLQLWERLLPRLPRLRELRFIAAPRHRGLRLEQCLPPLAGTALERVGLNVPVEELPRLIEWRRGVSPSFAVLVRPTGQDMLVELQEERLQLFAPSAEVLSAARLLRARRLLGDVDGPPDLETLIRQSWGQRPGLPEIHWPR